MTVKEGVASKKRIAGKVKEGEKIQGRCSKEKKSDVESVQRKNDKEGVVSRKIVQIYITKEKKTQ